MKVLVTASHENLNDVSIVTDDMEVSCKVSELEHMGFHSIETAVLKRVETIDETPWMCSDCCEITTADNLSDTESCPVCASHKLIKVS
jgi:rubrerythrin